MKIWIDLDNSPHVPLFRPVIDKLHKRNIQTIVTARNYAQTIDLLKFWNIPHFPVGKHGGKSKAKKILNLFQRSSQLKKFIADHKPDIALSHGSRTQTIAAQRLQIPCVVMMDYEYTESRIFNRFATKLLIPAFIPDQRLKENHFNLKKVIRYHGFKEQLYLKHFEPDDNFLEKNKLPADKIICTIRPPALLGNYHNPVSEKIIIKVIEKLVETNDVFPLIVSRTKEDRQLIESHFSEKVQFLEKAVNGLDLIWYSDMFISGGGTMNREAALLNVPTFSVFTGKKPFLDEYLAQRGKLTFIDSPDKIGLVTPVRRNRDMAFLTDSRDVADEVIDRILKSVG